MAQTMSPTILFSSALFLTIRTQNRTSSVYPFFNFNKTEACLPCLLPISFLSSSALPFPTTNPSIKEPLPHFLSLPLCHLWGKEMGAYNKLRRSQSENNYEDSKTLSLSWNGRQINASFIIVLYSIVNFFLFS